MKRSFIYILGLSLIISSCGIFKKKNKPVEIDSETPVFYKDWKYLSARLDAKTKIKGTQQNLGISLRMKKKHRNE